MQKTYDSLQEKHDSFHKKNKELPDKIKTHYQVFKTTFDQWTATKLGFPDPVPEFIETELGPALTDLKALQEDSERSKQDIKQLKSDLSAVAARLVITTKTANDAKECAAHLNEIESSCDRTCGYHIGCSRSLYRRGRTVARREILEKC